MSDWPKQCGDERVVLPTDKAAEFGQMILDIVSAHGDMNEEITEEQRRNWSLADSYTQMWASLKTQIQALELRLLAADEVMRLCEAYRGDEALDGAVTHYLALRDASNQNQA
jgi:hypothetical protein